MKKLLAALCLLLSMPASAALSISDATITKFDHNAGSATTSTITSVSITAGSIVLVYFGYQDNGTQSSFTCSDNSGQTTAWSSSQRQVGDLRKYSMFFWSYTAAGFSGATITITWPTSHSIDNGIAVLGIAGANTSAPIGAGGTQNTTASTASITFTSTGTQSMVLMGVTDWTANAVGSVGAGSTSLAAWGTAGQGTFGLQRLTSLVDAGSQNPTRTLGGSDEFAASAIEILAAATTGPANSGMFDFWGAAPSRGDSLALLNLANWRPQGVQNGRIAF